MTTSIMNFKSKKITRYWNQNTKQKSKAGAGNNVAADIMNSNSNIDKSDNNVIYGSLLWEIQGRG